MVTFVSEAQLANASSTIFVTLFGIVMLVRLVQFLNARPPILSISRLQTIIPSLVVASHLLAITGEPKEPVSGTTLTVAL